MYQKALENMRKAQGTQSPTKSSPSLMNRGSRVTKTQDPNELMSAVFSMLRGRSQKYAQVSKSEPKRMTGLAELGESVGKKLFGEPEPEVEEVEGEAVMEASAEDAPKDWATIQSNIFAGESGGDYDALFNYQNRGDGKFSDVKLTSMTVDEALQFADPKGPYASYVKGEVGRIATPMGAYQVVGSTLRDAKKGLGLTGEERMTKKLQDRIGQWIYENQGTGAWEGYKKG